jgi:hypothetical protein
MYSETVSDILIFKTNIFTTDIGKVAAALDNETRIKKWNIDCEDIDHVLRIETDLIEAKEVITIIQATGFSCEELPD